MTFRVAACAVVALQLGAGCAMGKFYLTDSGLESGAAAPEERRATVSVLPFTSQSGEDGDAKNIRAFEKHFLAANLVKVLGRAQYVSRALYTPAATPATDYYVEGDVVLSDGENVEVHLQLHEADGGVVYENTFGYANAKSDFDDPGYLEKPWYRAVNRINGVLSDRATRRAAAREEAERLGVVTTRGSLQKVRGYAQRGVPSDAVTPKILRAVAESSKHEIDALLTPLTARIETRCHAIQPRYVEWQRQSTANAIAARSAENRSRFSFILALIGAAGAGVAQANGDAESQQGFEKSRDDALAMSQEADAEADAHRQVIEDVSELFDDDIKEDALVVGEERLVVKGTAEQKAAQLHEAVRKVVVKAIPEEKVTATPLPEVPRS